MESATKYEYLLRPEFKAIEHQRWRIISIISNKHPIAIASNRAHSLPSRNYNNHSEIRCIKKTPKNKLKNGILYVYRLGFSGYRLAKPCPNCQKAIKAAGIKKVVFSTNEGKFEEMRF